MLNAQMEATLTLLQKVWTFFLIALYASGFLNEYHFPGVREEALEGEAILWNVQRLFFFALMFMGFLVDVVRMREDRDKAFVFLIWTLFLGGLSGSISSLQYRFIAGLFSG